MIRRRINIQSQLDAVNQAAAQALASAQSAVAVSQGQATANVNSKPIFLLDFLNTKAIDNRIGFTRSDTTELATYIASSGFYKVAKKGKPRFTHDPVTKKQLGLIYEYSSRTNFCLYNRDFTQNAWSKGAGGTSVTLGQTKTPFLDIGYNKIIEGTNNGGHLFAQNISLISDSEACLSFYAKSLETEAIRIELTAVAGANSNGFRVDLDIKNGVVLSVANIGTSAFSSTRVDIEPAPFGGYSISVYTKPSIAGITTRGILFYHLKNANIIYQGDGVSGYLLDIPQLELSEAKSSAIITQGTPATRSAEQITFDSFVFLDVFQNASEEGTILYCGRRTYEGPSAYKSIYELFSANTSGGVNKIKSMQAPNLDPYVEGFVDGVSQFTSTTTGNTSNNSMYASVFAYKKNSAKYFLNGIASGSSNTFTVPTMTSFNFGSANTIISCFAFWPKKLNDVECSVLTNLSTLFSNLSPNQSPLNLNLKSGAYTSITDLLKSTSRQHFTVDGTGASITRNIRFNFDFDFEIVDSSGCSITSQPSASCLANTDNALVFSAPLGKSLTYAVTPKFEY